MKKRAELSFQPWMYRLFWIGFHASSAMISGMLAVYHKATVFPWQIWFIFSLLTVYLCVRNYGKWHDAEVQLHKLKEKRRERT